MRQAPYRPKDEISQSYNDGIVDICTVTDKAEPGYLPRPVLSKLCTLRYAEQRLGISRYYSAKQNQIQVERVLRVPRAAPVTNQCVAITEDGAKYGIDLVQAVKDVYPPSLDLTLVQYTQSTEDIP